MQANRENAFLKTGVPYKRVMSHTFNCDWGEEYHSLHRSVDIKGARHPQENSQMKETGMLIISINILCMLNYLFLFVDNITPQCLDIRWNTPSRVWYITSRWLDIRWITPSCVWRVTSQCLDIRWITPSCVWYITYSVWMSDETLLLVFDILLLGVWISDESLRPVFDVLLLSVWISDESLRLVFDILLIVFGCQMKHSFLCLINYFSVFGYQMKHSFSCLIYHMKHSSCLIYKCI